MAGLRSMSESRGFSVTIFCDFSGATVQFRCVWRSRGGDAQVIVGEGGEAVAYEDRLEWPPQCCGTRKS